MASYSGRIGGLAGAGFYRGKLVARELRDHTGAGSETQMPSDGRAATAAG
jgi:hypothetical protein